MLAAGLSLFVDRYGPPPDHYVVVDTETTGFSPERDAVTQVGYGRVAGRAWDDGAGEYLNWQAPGACHPDDADRLRYAHGESRAQMLVKNGSVGPAWEEIVALGGPPADVAGRLADFLEARDVPVVGHNILGFDAAFLASLFARTGRRAPSALTPENLFDTGGLLKAALMGLRPLGGESRAGYFQRAVRARAKGVYWSLYRYAVPTFGLADKIARANLTPHDAASDALVTHWLLEALRDHCSTSA
jgi:DNA polymerase III epsilon subunit-like protein